MNQINPIGPVPGGQTPERFSKALPKKMDVPSFKDTLATFMKETDDLQSKASSSVEKFVAGEITDAHQVMAAGEDAKIAFNMLVELRNKALEAYNEIQRMRL